MDPRPSSFARSAMYRRKVGYASPRTQRDMPLHMEPRVGVDDRLDQAPGPPFPAKPHLCVGCLGFCSPRFGDTASAAWSIDIDCDGAERGRENPPAEGEGESRRIAAVDSVGRSCGRRETHRVLCPDGEEGRCCLCKQSKHERSQPDAQRGTGENKNGREDSHFARRR